MSPRAFSWLLALLVLSSVSCQETFTVKHVAEYCRHGARTTWYSPNLNLDLTQKLGTGALTPNGHRMQYLLGAQIRKNYESLFGPATPLGNKLTFKDVEVFASDKARSQLSAISQMAGVLPFGLGGDVTGQDAKWYTPPFANFSSTTEGTASLPERFYPVPLIVNHKDNDMLFFGDYGGSCPKAAQYGSNFEKQQYAKYDYLIADLHDELEKKGYSAQKLYNISKWDINRLALFSDEIITYENYHGKKYDDIEESLFEKVFLAHNVKFTSEFNDSKIVRMRSDAVARSIIAGMDKVVANSSDAKAFRLFSGHDTGTYAHMLLLGLTSLECLVNKTSGVPVTGRCEYIPDFASQFLYELVTNSKQEYFVRVLFNGDAIEICNGKKYCPYAEFKKTFADKLYMDPEEFLQFCGNPYLLAAATNSTKTLIKPFKISLVLIIGSIIIAILAVMVALKYRQIKHHSYASTSDDYLTEKNFSVKDRSPLSDALTRDSPN
jgi:hypothetical protein